MLVHKEGSGSLSGGLKLMSLHLKCCPLCPGPSLKKEGVDQGLLAPVSLDLWVPVGVDPLWVPVAGVPIWVPMA